MKPYDPYCLVVCGLRPDAHPVAKVNATNERALPPPSVAAAALFSGSSVQSEMHTVCVFYGRPGRESMVKMRSERLTRVSKNKARSTVPPPPQYKKEVMLSVATAPQPQ